MSTSLVWQIAPKNSYKSLPFELKQKLEQRYNFPVIVGKEIISYLEGLESCDIEGARKLIDLIEQFEAIELNIAY